MNPCCGPFQQSKHAFVLLSLTLTIALTVVSTSACLWNSLCLRRPKFSQASLSYVVENIRSMWVCWQDRDFKVLGPCFTGISAPSHVSHLHLQTDSPPILPCKRFQRATTCLVQSSCGLPALRLKCNSKMTDLGEKNTVYTGTTSTNSLVTKSDDKILMWLQSAFVKSSSYTSSASEQAVCGLVKIYFQELCCFLLILLYISGNLLLRWQTAET